LMFTTAAARARLEQMVPELAIKSVEWLSLFAYPLSGGFKPWCLWLAALVTPMLRLEDVLLPALGPFFGFRLFVVLERR